MLCGDPVSFVSATSGGRGGAAPDPATGSYLLLSVSRLWRVGIGARLRCAEALLPLSVVQSLPARASTQGLAQGAAQRSDPGGGCAVVVVLGSARGRANPNDPTKPKAPRELGVWGSARPTAKTPTLYPDQPAEAPQRSRVRVSEDPTNKLQSAGSSQPPTQPHRIAVLCPTSGDPTEWRRWEANCKDPPKQKTDVS